MAITVSSRPNEYSNSAIFITSTDVAEDSTHVNTRIEASLYVDGAVIAKKVKPKGITTFDFTEILNSRCLFTTPALDPSNNVDIVSGGKVGSNLITGWTNNAHPTDFATFTTSGNGWTSVISELTGTATCYTNSIAVTTGKTYVLLFFSTSTVPLASSVQVKTTPANGNVLGWADTQLRGYFQARTTGNIELEFTVITTGTAANFAGTWGMYELDTCDWWCPYYVVFTEKYEDAAGATQTGASSTETQLGLFFKSNVTSLNSYLMAGATDKFLKSDGYNLSTNARSYSLFKTLPSGMRTSAFNAAIIYRSTAEIKYRLTPYNASGVAQADVDGSFEDVYSPIVVIQCNEGIFGTYPRGDIKIMNRAGTSISEVLQFDQNVVCFPNLLHLIWRSKVGGFSEYTFPYNIGKIYDVEKEYYKDSNKKDKIIPTSIIDKNTITALTALGVTEKQLEYIQDIIYSNQCYWHQSTTVLTPVTVRSEAITTKQDIELTPFQIEVSW